MPRGANNRREHEYEELKDRFKKEGRYKGREEEVASRIVNKQRAQYGETKAEKQEEHEGRSPDKNVPIPHYRHMSERKIEPKLKTLSKKQLDKVENYEEKHKDRKNVKAAIEKEKRGKKAA